MKKIGIIGIAIPLLFLISFSILFLEINPLMIEQAKGISIIALNVKGTIGKNWIAYVNYFSLGFLIVIFCLLLLLKTVNSSITLVGKIFLLISGLSWMLLGVIGLEIGDSKSAIYLVSSLLLNLGLGSLGFIFLSANSEEFKKIMKSKFVRWGVFLCGIFIIIFWIISLSSSDYQEVLRLLCWTLYFWGFGLLGIGLIYQKKEASEL